MSPKRRLAATLAIVRKIGVVQADADSLRLSLELSTGLKGLRLLADSGTVLQSIAAPAPVSGAPATESVARFGLR